MRNFRNKSRIPDILLVTMKYVFRDKKTRLLKGAVTSRGYGRWNYGEVGQVHVADAIVFVQRGLLYPVDQEDYTAKVKALNDGGIRDIKKKIPRLLDVSKLRGVGPATHARFLEIGLDTVEKVAAMNALALSEQLQLIHINEARAQAIIEDAIKVLASHE